jgi:purine-nucleoside phosphorylase
MSASRRNLTDAAELLDATLDRWEGLGWPAPDLLLVSGSGLAVDLGEPLRGPVPLGELLPFPTEGIEGHPMEVALLEPIPGRRALYHRGRVHGYQGHPPAEVVAHVRLAGHLGARTLVMTNAAGGLDPDHRPGDLVAVSDHLNLTGWNPLHGGVPAEWGPRFPDMVGAYDPELRRLLHAKAEELGIALREGVYAGLAGPSYETPAEVRMLQTLGANLAGMSTVQEVIAARHLGMRCGVVSLVTNPAAGVTGEPLDHDEVLEAGREAAGRVRSLLTALLRDPAAYGAPAE